MPGLKRKEIAVDEKLAKKAKRTEKVASSSNEKPFRAKVNLEDKPKNVVGEIYDGSSKEAHAKQRALAKERKAAKPNADIIHRAKKLWERLRLKSHVDPEQRKTLVKELFEIITGRVSDFVFKHDSVRVIQCALKYGNLEQRKSIAKELKGQYRELAESRYAKFLIAKLLVTGDNELKEMVLSEFYGHVKRLLNHPEASWILDDTYRAVATRRQKAIMLRELYGPEYAIFKTADSSEAPVADLETILNVNPEKRKPIMNHLHQTINALVQKKLTGFTLLHDAMLQYSLALGAPSSSEASAEFLELLKSDDEGDLLKNLAFTPSGARVLCRALAYGNAKDRKTILRVFKEHIETLAYDVNGSLVILTAYEVVDDTVLTSKLFFPEILAVAKSATSERYDAIVAHANHPIARMSLLYPLASSHNSKWLFPASSPASAILSEIRTLRSDTSKKAPETRLLELAKALSGHDNILLETIAQRTTELVSTPFGPRFISEVLLGLPADDPSARAPALNAIAALAAGETTTEGHIAQDPAAGRMLKSLALGGHYDTKTRALVPIEPALGFADILWSVVQDRIVEWASGKGSFVVVGLVESPQFGGKKDLLKALRKEKKTLDETAKDGNKGTELLVKML